MTIKDTLLSTRIARQVKQTVLGEIVGTAVSVGAVYLFRQYMPTQTQYLTNFFEKTINSDVTDNAQRVDAANRKVDVTYMQLGGVANMATQFAFRRSKQLKKGEEREPFFKELGRVIVGRVAGTGGSLAALNVTDRFAENAVGNFEDKVKGTVERIAPINTGNPNRSQQLAERIVSSLIQSGGAMGANASMQLVYDQVLAGKGTGRH